MPTCYGYARASTGRQTLTFDVQRTAIERYFKEKLEPQGYTWGGLCEDKATSGGKPFTERAGGLKLWTDAKAGDCIVWMKMDRAFRSVVDGASMMQMFRTKGVALHSLDIGLDTSTPLGEFVMHLLILLAQLERSWISSRTKDAFAAKRARGEPTNQKGVPAGWKRVGLKGNAEFIRDDKERRLVESCWTMWIDNKSLEKLAAKLAWKNVKRHGGSGYNPQWILYSFFARARSYPMNYTFSQWKATQQAMAEAGTWDSSHEGLLGLMESTQENAESS